ncbi:MAG: FprA family A-type flavoprotein [Agathobacter sp.]|nr:FprA family A-type flavoprotein [Agathobacter sp.]
MKIEISEKIKYIGVDDTTLDLFESQYVIPDGVSYNSYVILDEKVAVIDTVDERMEKEWLENLCCALNGRTVDYLVIQHLEPDHTGGIIHLMEMFPEMTLVGNQKTFLFLSQFLSQESGLSKCRQNCGIQGTSGELENFHKLVVKEKDTICLGEHTLHFYMAAMVHWPEVLVTYESTERILFSADAFGKFGALEVAAEDDWACEARRYYFNIVGKYGIAVQALMSKVKELKIQMICPAHGPILSQPLDEYLRLYDIWSRYEPETSGVLIAFGSFHGNSKKAAEYLAGRLVENGFFEVVLRDMVRDDMSEIIEDAFRYDRMIIVASSYEGGVFPQVREFLHRLQSKGYQKRKVAIVENGTWSPSAGRTIRELLESMKAIEIVEPMVTIYSVMNECNMEELNTLADEMV